MSEFGKMLTGGARMSVGLAEKLLKDVRPQDFARKPQAGGKLIDTNHPAFILGHLALYPARWLTTLGVDPAAAAVPATFEGLFAAGKECRDDPEGSIYPPMREITEAYFNSHKAAILQLPRVEDAVFLKPNPREGMMKELYPALAGMMMFYTLGHPMTHLGQFSAWRRCFGLGSAM